MGYAPAKERQSLGAERTAVFCLYREPDRVHRNVPFRDTSGQPVPGMKLELVLADFIPDTVPNNWTKTTSWPP